MTIGWGIAILAVVTTGIQLGYWLVLFSKLAFYGRRQEILGRFLSCLPGGKAAALQPGTTGEIILQKINEGETVVEAEPAV